MIVVFFRGWQFHGIFRVSFLQNPVEINKLVSFRVCVKDLGQMTNEDYNKARVTDGLKLAFIEGGFVAWLAPLMFFGIF